MKLRRPTDGDRVAAVFRIYLGGNALITWLMATYEQLSVLHLLSSTAEGAVLAWLLMVVGVAALVDAVVNDLMPDRFHWRVAKKQRHFILVAMAFCYAAQLYVAFVSMRSPGLLLYYLLNVGTIMAAAFFDANKRSKDASCVMACN
jgi:hypothetical protein